MKKDAVLKSKFKQLKRRLGLPHWQVVGVLESVWRVAESSTPAGDIGRLSDEQIAAELEWAGDPGELVDALVDARWLDRDPVFRLLVHDWSVHCPNHLKGGFAREKKLFADQIVAKRLVQSGGHSDPPSQADSQATSLAPQLGYPANSYQPPNLALPNHTKPDQPTPQPPFQNPAEMGVDAAGNGRSVGRSVEFVQTWDAVGQRLVTFGVERAAEAISACRRNGCQPGHAHHLIDYATQNDKGPGALVDRLKLALPTLGVNRGWTIGDGPEVVAKQQTAADRKRIDTKSRDHAQAEATHIIKTGRRAKQTDDEIKAALAAAGLEWPK